MGRGWLLWRHAAGLYFDLPLLVGLAYKAYFLNLWNLTPLGFLDGGKIVAAQSPWLWIPWLFIILWFVLETMNPILIFILIMSIPQVISLFWSRTEEQQRYVEVTPLQRFKVAGMYFGLIAALFVGMHVTHDQLKGIRQVQRQSARGGQYCTLAILSSYPRHPLVTESTRPAYILRLVLQRRGGPRESAFPLSLRFRVFAPLRFPKKTAGSFPSRSASPHQSPFIPKEGIGHKRKRPRTHRASEAVA